MCEQTHINRTLKTYLRSGQSGSGLGYAFNVRTNAYQKHIGGSMDDELQGARSLRSTKKLIFSVVRKRQKIVNQELASFGARLALRSRDHQIVVPQLAPGHFLQPEDALRQGWIRVKWPDGFEVWQLVEELRIVTACIPNRTAPTGSLRYSPSNSRSIPASGQDRTPLQARAVALGPCGTGATRHLPRRLAFRLPAGIQSPAGPG